MATYEATVASAWPADDTFDYLADFSNAQQWDPGVLSGQRLGHGADTTGPVRKGEDFRLVVPFLGRQMALVYRVQHISHENREVLFEARNSLLNACDRIAVRQAADRRGSIVTYRADITLRGPLALLDPVLGRGFRAVGDRAVNGLTAMLSRPAASGQAGGPARTP